MAGKKRKQSGDGPEGGSSGAAGGGDGNTTTAAAAGTIPAVPVGWNLKKKDGEPLLRNDLQWDLLHSIFTNSEFRFTPPVYPSAALPLFPTDRTWSFAELYLDCLSNSSKANKNVKEKMAESPEYAINFGKLCLLINVGRANTTLAFYPEMRTQLRTYHAIPAMQLEEHTRRNLQDAPRMKAQLKGCSLPQEQTSLPTLLADVIERGKSGSKPPTCVVQLIFLLFAEQALLSEKYCPTGRTLFDLFLPPPDPAHAISSEQRAYAFLWLVHRFLQAPEQVAADFTSAEPKVPADAQLVLTDADCSAENQDTMPEREFGEEMLRVRHENLERMKLEKEEKDREGGTPGTAEHAGTPIPGEKLLKGGKKGGTPRASSLAPSLSKRARSTTSQDPMLPSSPLPHSVSLAYAMSQDFGSVSSPAASVGDTTFTWPFSEAAHASDKHARASAVPMAASLSSKGRAIKMGPVENGVAAPAVYQQWMDFCKLGGQRNASLLQLQWQRVKRDIDSQRDPVYDSDEKNDWTATELKTRILGFAFRDHVERVNRVVTYQGPGPNIDPELLTSYASSFDANGVPLSPAPLTATNGASYHPSMFSNENGDASMGGEEPAVDYSTMPQSVGEGDEMEDEMMDELDSSTDEERDELEEDELDELPPG